ncbi:low-affinity phosphate transporter [Rhizina undulata]
MKFSHSIQFNAVPDWSSHYIAYSNLKKLIYSLEKNVAQAQASVAVAGEDSEHTALIAAEHIDPDSVFRRALDNELEKIEKFYKSKEIGLFREVAELSNEAAEFEGGMDKDFPIARPHLMAEGSRRSQCLARTKSTQSDREVGAYDDSDDEEDEEDALGTRSGLLPKLRRGNSNTGASQHSRPPSEYSINRRHSAVYEDDDEFIAFHDKRITLKKRAISLFVALRELRSFIQLNKTGFSKALKKYDKIMYSNLRNTYLEHAVAPAYVFRKATMAELDSNIATIEAVYAALVTDGDLEEATKELRLHLREHVVWERNTVWREMIGIERKSNAANIALGRTLLGDNDPTKAALTGDEDQIMEMKELYTPVGRIKYPRWLFSAGFFTLLGSVALFGILLAVPTFHTPEQQNCFALLVFVSLLWATEVIPLFVTSLIIPFLVVILRVARADQKPHNRLHAKEATKYIFSAMWTPVIMLLLGGFTIAAALSKYGIAKRMATFVLSKAGTRPRTVLVANMFVAMFASMWISNVAAPVLCFSIVQPLLRNLPAESNFSKALILGIALASNIGGMASPIASPQNIIALQNMKSAPSWGAWFFVALPVCVVSILIIWVLLLISFKPGKGTTIMTIRPVKDKFTGVQYFISLTTFVTIALWCVSHQLENVFGDMGVIAIIPLVLFFGTGVLTKEDFNNFLWTIIILAAGGLSLGKAVDSSGLLHTIANAIKLEVEGMSLYGVLVVFCGLILVIATFISHTVAALIILPIVAQVGSNMEEPHPNLLVMGSALMCSAAMGLPTSGFPNMTAIMMEDSQTGVRYLRVRHFISRGIPSSILTFLIVVTMGYGLMRIADF